MMPDGGPRIATLSPSQDLLPLDASALRCATVHEIDGHSSTLRDAPWRKKLWRKRRRAESPCPSPGSS
jgi:hypothetical protein